MLAGAIGADKLGNRLDDLVDGDFSKSAAILGAHTAEMAIPAAKTAAELATAAGGAASEFVKHLHDQAARLNSSAATLGKGAGTIAQPAIDTTKDVAAVAGGTAAKLRLLLPGPRPAHEPSHGPFHRYKPSTKNHDR